MPAAGHGAEAWDVEARGRRLPIRGPPPEAGKGGGQGGSNNCGQAAHTAVVSECVWQRKRSGHAPDYSNDPVFMICKLCKTRRLLFKTPGGKGVPTQPFPTRGEAGKHPFRCALHARN